jgi:flagellar biosynthesis protein FlhG
METPVPMRSPDSVRSRSNRLGAGRGECPSRPALWAVAGGGRGVGVSVLCSSLAIGLAQTGPRSIAVDLDLGGPTLHALFGCRRARYTVADALRGRLPHLRDALLATSVPGVRLLAGERGAPDATALRAADPRRIAALRSLDAGHVVVDLGTGEAPLAHEVFAAADRRVLVTTAEAGALTGVRAFVVAAFLGSLSGKALEPAAREALAPLLVTAAAEGWTPRALLEAASRRDAEAASSLRRVLDDFAIELVVNRVDASRDRDGGNALAETLGAELGVEFRLAAALGIDSSVPAAVTRGVPVMQLFPGGAFASDVRELVERWSGFAASPAPARRVPRLRREPVPGAWVPLFGGADPGRHLRLCRELQNLTLAQLHERTCIRYRHLESIEAERYDALPPDFYLLGYVRQIAEALGAPDGEAIARAFLERARKARAAGAAASRPATPSSPVGRPAARRTVVPQVGELMALCDFEPELDASDSSG